MLAHFKKCKQRPSYRFFCGYVLLTFFVQLIMIALVGCTRRREEQVSPKKLEFDFRKYDYSLLIAKKIADLRLPSGRVMVGDAFGLYDQKPLNRRVSPGTYPVTVFVKKFEESGYDDYRVVMAKVSFSNAKAVRWELAIFEDTDHRFLSFRVE